MNKLSRNQKGFTAVEGLLIVLILVVIGGVGYMVYHNSHKAKTVTTSNTAAKSLGNANGGRGGVEGPDTGPAKTELYIIPEWKVSAAIPPPPTTGTAKDSGLIQYKITSVNGQAAAYFTSQELIDSDKTHCTADNAPAGIVMKALPTDTYYSPGDGSTNGQTVSQALQSGVATYYKEVAGYDYWYIHPQGVCSIAPNGSTLVNNAIKPVEEIVSNLTIE